MKKKLLTGVAIVTLAVGGLMVTRPTTQSPLSELQMENLETLSASETLTMGCIYAPDEICVTYAFDSYDNPVMMILENHKYVQK